MNTLKIDEDAVEIIRYIFRSFLGGVNKNKIARELNIQDPDEPGVNGVMVQLYDIITANIVNNIVSCELKPGCWGK